jgi:transcriptional regulator with XRE-family HTH domain
MNQVGPTIRELRELKGMNQLELAYLAGMAPSAISQIETGKRNPSSVTLFKLARALDVEVSDLFPKWQAPLLVDESEEESPPPERRALFASWARYIDDHNAWFAYQLNHLPQQPTADEWDQGTEKLNALLTTSSMALDALKEERVEHLLVPYVEAINAGAPVPDDVRQAAMKLRAALSFLVLQLFPQASSWVRRTGEAREGTRQLEAMLNEQETKGKQMLARRA